SRECVHVRDNDRFASGGGRSADTAPERDAHARGFALEGPDYQLAATHEVEPRPAHLGQHVEEQRGGVGGVGDRIRLAREQTPKLRGQALVAGTLVTEVVALAVIGRHDGMLRPARWEREGPNRFALPRSPPSP